MENLFYLIIFAHSNRILNTDIRLATKYQLFAEQYSVKPNTELFGINLDTNTGYYSFNILSTNADLFNVDIHYTELLKTVCYSR